LTARRTCTQRGWRLLTLVATTCTSSEMKAPSRHKSSLSGSFRQVSRVGLTLQLRGTAPSDEDGLFNATARDRRRGCLRCNSRENHGSDGVPFLHNAVLLSTIISLNLRGVALHRCGRAGHYSTRITCGYYRTRASQIGGHPFNAQEFEQNCFAVRGNTIPSPFRAMFPKSKQFTARNLPRKKRRYWRYCQPDESYRRQSLGLQPASQHILRCPARYHRCTSTGGGGTLELLYRF